MLYVEPGAQTLNPEDYRVNLAKPPGNNDFCLFVRGRRVGSFGNLVTITGKPKARKSVFIHGFIAAALTRGTYYHIKIELEEARNHIILIDTEQDQGDIKRALEMLNRRIGNDLKHFPHFHAYSLRMLSPADVLRFIKITLDQNPKTGLILIDGLLDTINDMNNVQEARDVMQEIKQICNLRRVLVVGVVHQSKSSNFSIGHLGSFADRFAQAVLQVEKDPKEGGSVFSPVYMRSDAHFEPVEIYFNNNKGHYQATDE